MTIPAQNQNMSSSKNQENTRKLNAEIKKTWSKMSDSDIALCQTNREQFFATLKEKQGVSKETGEKTLQDIEKSCGCSMPACSSENPAAVKSA